MAGDITRTTFETSKHYSGVRMQQGRVQMDADWNEQLDIRLYTDRTTNRDVIGACGAPEANAANANFAVRVQPGGNLLLKAGRIYVGGILCEAETDALIALPSPAGAIPVQPDLPGVDFSGPGFAFEPLLNSLGGGPNFKLPTSVGTYTAYLDVWEREITALADPLILEVALGGPDTATRRKVVWQAKLLFLNEATSGITCPVDWSSLIPPSTGTLAARSTPDPPNTNPCAVPATAGYRRLENQLYRVEVHTGGSAGTASFKFSRDNGSVTAGWLGQDGSNPNNLFVSTLGRDQVLGFTGGQWVELTDDTRELWDIPGTLVQLKTAQVTAQGPTITIDPATASPPGAITFANFPRNPKIRRWDQLATATQPLTGGAIPLKENQWLDLEDGVQVRFDTGGFCHTGDYWLIPARTATAITNPAVEWPKDPSNTPIQKPAFGIRHSYCSLALLTYSPISGFSLQKDCRDLFPPLTDICAKDVCFDNTNCALPGATTVQQAIDQLCRASKGGCCTITVSPNDITSTNTLQNIVDSVAGKQAAICLSPGVYSLAAPLVLTAKHNNLTIEGCHPDVILQVDATAAPAPFLQGMFILIGTDRITLQGLRFELPAIPFPQNGGRFADLSIEAIRSVDALDPSTMSAGIAVRVLESTNLRIESCFFHFQVAQLRIFEAGIFTGGTCSGLVFKDNTFLHEAQIGPGSTEVRFGMLHAPTVSNATITAGPAGDTVAGAILPARLDDVAICGNLFSGLTAAAFVHAEIGAMRVDRNVVLNCYCGFEIFTLRFQRTDAQLAKYVGVLHDLAFSLASAIAEGYPLPPGFDPKAAGQITVPAQGWVPVRGASPDPVIASAFLLDSMYAVLEVAAFLKLARTIRSLAFIAVENQIDVTNIVPGQAALTAGSGLVIGSEISDAGSVSIGASRIHNRSPLPAAAVFYAIVGSATGNVIMNETAANAGISLVVAPAPPPTAGPSATLSAVAVMGNLLRGAPDLPPHAGAAAPFDRWEPLNQIVLV